MRIPVGSAEPGERGYEDDTSGVGDRSSKCLGLGCLVDDLEPVPQPLHGGTGHEHCAFDGIGESSVGVLPRDGGEEAVGGRDGVVAGVDQDEGTGPVGALARAGLDASLAEQGGLLVAGDPGDGEIEPEERPGIGTADHAVRRDHLGQCVHGHVEQVAELLTPGAEVDVEQQGARGVGRIGDVVQSPRHPGDQVGVDGADRDTALLDLPPHLRFVELDPRELRAGEVGVESQPGQLRHARLVSIGAQLVADPCSTPVLPDDGAPRGAQGLAVPQDDRLALIGDPERRRSISLGAEGVECLLHCGQSCGPDLVRVVLDPAFAGEVLRELRVAARDDLGLLRDDQGGDAGGAGVEGEHAHVTSGGEGGAAEAVT